MTTQIDATTVWKINCEGDDITEFMQVVSRLYKDEDYLDRVSWSRMDEDDDREDVTITVDTIEALAELLPLAIKCGYNYHLEASLKVADCEERQSPVTAWTAIGKRRSSPLLRSDLYVTLGAEAEVLAKRIRSAVSVLNGGAL